MIIKKKGQAAMEFLMTYGWAILAAIVAIGVLAYFGVFSPGKLAGSSAIVNNPFYAKAWQVSTPGNISLELTNNGGDGLIISMINVSQTGSSTPITCTNQTIAGILNPGTDKLVTIPCGASLTTGNSFAGNILIVYSKSGSSLNQTSTGTIRSSIQ